MKVRNILILVLSSVLISGLILYSCKRKQVEYLGPEYLSAPSDFTVTNFTATSPVDFTVSACTLAAQFSSRVSYTLTIKGLTSGAKKTFVGVDSKIDLNSPGGLWKGEHDDLYFFRAESVEITLSFIGTDLTAKKTVTVTKPKNYIVGPNIIPLSATNNGYELGSESGFPSQFSIGSGKTNCQQTTGPAVNAKRSDTAIIHSIEGQYFFRVLGKSNDANGYFVGGLQHRTGDGLGSGQFFFPATWTDPSKVYFNIFVYGTGDGITSINLEFHESDLSTVSTKPRPECGLTGGNCGNITARMHNPCTDDGWVYQYPVKHKGWKLISVRYSDCTPSASLLNGGSGDKLKEPTRVVRLQMGVVSAPPFNSVNAYWDYPVITYGAPFNPNN